MNYWPTDAVGLGECFTPLVDFAEKLAANGTATAKAYFDADGWCACHNSDIWGATYPADSRTATATPAATLFGL